MELIINIVLMALYALSILHLGFRYLMLFACYGDPRGALHARYRFYRALALFIVMSGIMIFRFSIWFGIPVIFLLIIPLLVYLNDEMQYKIRSWKKKKTAIDRTE